MKTRATDVTVNGATVAIGASKPTYVTSNIHDAATSINDATDNVKNGWTVEFAEKYQPDLALKDTTDDFGRPAHTWTWKKAEIGTYVDFDKMVAEYTTKVTGEDLYNLLGSSVIDSYDFNIAIDGETDEDVLDGYYFTEGNLVRSNTNGVGGTGDGVLTEVYVDVIDKEVTIAIINTYLAKASSDYNEKRDEVTFTVYGLNNSTKPVTVSGEDFAIEDVAEDDLFW